MPIIKPESVKSWHGIKLDHTHVSRNTSQYNSKCGPKRNALQQNLIALLNITLTHIHKAAKGTYLDMLENAAHNLSFH